MANHSQLIAYTGRAACLYTGDWISTQCIGEVEGINRLVIMCYMETCPKLTGTGID